MPIYKPAKSRYNNSELKKEVNKMNATKSPLYLALIRRCERFLELVDKDAPDVVINMEVQGIQDVIEAIAKEEKKGE